MTKEELEKENAELKGLKDVATLIRANNDTVITLMQLNNKLVSKSQQLTKAKELLERLLITSCNSDVLNSGVTMFEKEAEEIANKRCHEIMCYGHCSFSSPKHHRCGEWHREYECALKGAEFGYNKANEWHYVKDGDLPKVNELVLIKITGCFVLGWTNGTNWFNDSSNGTIIDRRMVIAWKEIVLPKENK